MLAQQALVSSSDSQGSSGYRAIPVTCTLALSVCRPAPAPRAGRCATSGGTTSRAQSGCGAPSPWPPRRPSSSPPGARCRPTSSRSSSRARPPSCRRTSSSPTRCDPLCIQVYVWQFVTEGHRAYIDLSAAGIRGLEPCTVQPRMLASMRPVHEPASDGVSSAWGLS